MKKLFLLAVICSTTHALQAPYLISAIALSDIRIVLTWRNNDIATQGFVILRKSESELSFTRIDSITNATVNTYTDSLLKDSTTYHYRIFAYGASVLSDTSNEQSVTTPKKNPVFKRPGLSVSFQTSGTSNFTSLTIYDSSDNEEGFIVYRSEEFSPLFNAIYEVNSVVTANNKSILLNDSTIKFNTWYIYKIAVFKNSDTLFSSNASIYTFRDPWVGEIVKFQKISDFPISYPGGLAALGGDSIILKENPSPPEAYTAISVKDVRNPIFSGYIDSTALLNYPVESRIPVYLKFNVSDVPYYPPPSVQFYCNSSKVFVFGNLLLLMRNNFLFLYTIQGNNLLPKDSLGVGTDSMATPDFSDSVLLTFSYLGNGGFQIEPIQFNGLHLSPLSSSLVIDNNKPNMLNALSFTVSGFRNNTLYSVGSYGYCFPRNGCSQVSNFVIMDCKASNVTEFVYSYEYPVNSAWPILSSTLCFLSPFTALFVNNTVSELYGIDIRSPASYQYSVSNQYCASNNGCYSDSIGQLKNILVDTLNKRIYLFRPTRLSIIGYYFENITTIKSNRPAISKQALPRFDISVVRNVVTVSKAQAPFSLSLFDVSGRLIDNLKNISTREIFWRPRVSSHGIYLLKCEANEERYSRLIFIK